MAIDDRDEVDERQEIGGQEERRDIVEICASMMKLLKGVSDLNRVRRGMSELERVVRVDVQVGGVVGRILVVLASPERWDDVELSVLWLVVSPMMLQIAPRFLMLESERARDTQSEVWPSLMRSVLTSVLCGYI